MTKRKSELKFDLEINFHETCITFTEHNKTSVRIRSQLKPFLAFTYIHKSFKLAYNSNSQGRQWQMCFSTDIEQWKFVDFLLNGSKYAKMFY